MGAATTRPRYYGMLWRWHFFAALIVIPFVLWQSTTGTLYLWSEWWMDRAYPQLRFVPPAAGHAEPSTQIAAALADLPVSPEPADKHSGPHTGTAMMPSGMTMAMPMASNGGQPAVIGILLPDNPTRSTTVLLQSPTGLPYPVFVDPYTAHVLGRLPAIDWLPGWSRSLHGGWPLGKAGSWLLELGDCWAIVMILTGFYLWWPRRRKFPQALWPRFHLGTRIMLRDLHSGVAVIFSMVFLFFLVSALPWTSFWGGEVLRRIETVTGQSSPAPFSNGGATPQQILQSSQALDVAVRETRARGVRGTLDIRLAPWDNAGWWLANVRTLQTDHTLQAAPGNGHIDADFTNNRLPAIPRFVAFGIHVHQGDFGAANLWLNTLFALSLVWLTVTGIASWWIRRPAGKLAPPPRTDTRWPPGLRAGAAFMVLLLPIFGLSVITVLIGDALFRRTLLRGSSA
jgi:uncharacterized iron-regulated membrane protein